MGDQSWRSSARANAWLETPCLTLKNEAGLQPQKNRKHITRDQRHETTQQTTVLEPIPKSYLHMGYPIRVVGKERHVYYCRKMIGRKNIGNVVTILIRYCQPMRYHGWPSLLSHARNRTALPFSDGPHVGYRRPLDIGLHLAHSASDLPFSNRTALGPSLLGPLDFTRWGPLTRART